MLRTLLGLVILATTCVAQEASLQFNKTVMMGGDHKVSILATVPASVTYQLGFSTNNPNGTLSVGAVATSTTNTPATTTAPATTITNTFFFTGAGIIVYPGQTVSVELAPASCDSRMVCVAQPDQIVSVVVAVQIMTSSAENLTKVTTPVLVEEDTATGTTTGTTRRIPVPNRGGGPNRSPHNH